MAAWSLILRNGPSVERERFDTLDEALSALESRVEGWARQARREPVTVFRRRFEAVQQVAARGELAGPTRLLPAVRGGVDLRGDGSTEAYTGRWRRRLVTVETGETAYDALRRALRPGVR
jgi:hypothetical protein